MTPNLISAFILVFLKLDLKNTIKRTRKVEKLKKRFKKREITAQLRLSVLHLKEMFNALQQRPLFLCLELHHPS